MTRLIAAPDGSRISPKVSVDALHEFVATNPNWFQISVQKVEIPEHRFLDILEVQTCSDYTKLAVLGIDNPESVVDVKFGSEETSPDSNRLVSALRSSAQSLRSNFEPGSVFYVFRKNQ